MLFEDYNLKPAYHQKQMDDIKRIQAYKRTAKLHEDSIEADKAVRHINNQDGIEHDSQSSDEGNLSTHDSTSDDDKLSSHELSFKNGKVATPEINKEKKQSMAVIDKHVAYHFK